MTAPKRVLPEYSEGRGLGRGLTRLASASFEQLSFSHKLALFLARPLASTIYLTPRPCRGQLSRTWVRASLPGSDGCSRGHAGHQRSDRSHGSAFSRAEPPAAETDVTRGSLRRRRRPSEGSSAVSKCASTLAEDLSWYIFLLR